MIKERTSFSSVFPDLLPLRQAHRLIHQEVRQGLFLLRECHQSPQEAKADLHHFLLLLQAFQHRITLQRIRPRVPPCQYRQAWPQDHPGSDHHPKVPRLTLILQILLRQRQAWLRGHPGSPMKVLRYPHLPLQVTLQGLPGCRRKEFPEVLQPSVLLYHFVKDCYHRFRHLRQLLQHHFLQQICQIHQP